MDNKSLFNEIKECVYRGITKCRKPEVSSFSELVDGNGFPFNRTLCAFATDYEPTLNFIESTIEKYTKAIAARIELISGITGNVTGTILVDALESSIQILDDVKKLIIIDGAELSLINKSTAELENKYKREVLLVYLKDQLFKALIAVHISPKKIRSFSDLLKCKGTNNKPSKSFDLNLGIIDGGTANNEVPVLKKEIFNLCSRILNANAPNSFDLSLYLYDSISILRKLSECVDVDIKYNQKTKEQITFVIGDLKKVNERLFGYSHGKRKNHSNITSNNPIDEFVRNLSMIDEEMDPSSKVLNYINRVFARDYARYIFDTLNRNGVQDEEWFYCFYWVMEAEYHSHNNAKTAKKFKLHKHFPAFSTTNGYYFDFDVQSSCLRIKSELLSIIDPRKLESFFVNNSDIQFLRDCVKVLNGKSPFGKNSGGKPYATSFYGIPSTVQAIASDWLAEDIVIINECRNDIAHSGASGNGSDLVIRTLKNLVETYERMGKTQQSNILKKRLVFEFQRNGGFSASIDRGYFRKPLTKNSISSYSEVDYRYFSLVSNSLNTNYSFSPIIDERLDSLKTIVSRIMEEATIDDGRKSRVMSFYYDNALFFPYTISKKDGTNIFTYLNECAPFHPMYLLFLFKLEKLGLQHESVIRIAKKDYNNLSDNFLIMPYSIDFEDDEILRILKEALKIKTSSDDSCGWDYFSKFEIGPHSYVEHCSGEDKYCSYLRSISKILLLGTICDLPFNRDLLRFCIATPNSNLTTIEESIDLLKEHSLFLSDNYHYRLPQNEYFQQKFVFDYPAFRRVEQTTSEIGPELTMEMHGEQSKRLVVSVIMNSFSKRYPDYKIELINKPKDLANLSKAGVAKICVVADECYKKMVMSCISSLENNKKFICHFAKRFSQMRMHLAISEHLFWNNLVRYLFLIKNENQIEKYYENFGDASFETDRDDEIQSLRDKLFKGDLFLFNNTLDELDVVENFNSNIWENNEIMKGFFDDAEVVEINSQE